MSQKHTPASILRHNQKIYLLAEWPKEKMKLTEIEQLIIEARLIGNSFSMLSEDDLKYSCDQIMLKGAAISGCALPQTEFFAEIISGQICEFICKFGYGELTLNEIVLSLQINAKTGLRFPTGSEVEQVQFVGNCFHVDYLSRVLSNYMALRNLLDSKFKNFIDGY